MITRSGRKQPSSTGWSGVVRHLMRSRQALIVMASPQLNGPATCGLEPVKSTVIAPSSSVIAISTRIGWSRLMPSLSEWPTARYVPAGMRRELGARAALGLLHVDARGLEHGVAPVAGEDLAEVRLAGAAHRDHRLHVLERAALDADVAADDAHHFLVQLAPARSGARTGSAGPPGGSRWSPPAWSSAPAAHVAPVRLHRDEAGELSRPRTPARSSPRRSRGCRCPRRGRCG